MWRNVRPFPSIWLNFRALQNAISPKQRNPLTLFRHCVWNGIGPTFGSDHRKGWRRKQRQRTSRLFGGQNLLNSLPRLLFCLGWSTEAKQLAPQGIEKYVPPKQTQWPLPLLLSPSFFYGPDTYCCICSSRVMLDFVLQAEIQIIFGTVCGIQ